MTAPRVPYDLQLRGDDIEELKRQLNDILKLHAEQINQTAFDYTTVSSTAAVASDIVIARSDSQEITINLPPAVDFIDREMRVKRVGTNIVRIVPVAGENIDQTATVELSTSLFTFSCVSDGKEWWIV